MGHFFKWPEKSSISRNGPQKNRKYEDESLNFVIKPAMMTFITAKGIELKFFWVPF